MKKLADKNISIILINIILILAIIKICKITGFCFTIISLISPLFFGYCISWIIRPLIEKLKKLNKIIIINSNDIEFINEVSDDIIVLNKGSIILSENKENLFNYISSLEENNIEIPHIIEFIDLVRRIKKINLNLTLDIEKLVENIKEHV